MNVADDAIVRVARLECEVQAQLLDAILAEQKIPHVIRSYHDAALDGVFQSTMGWGHVEAPARYRDEILAIIRDMTAGDAATP